MKQKTSRIKWLAGFLLALACFMAAVPVQAAALKKVSLYDKDFNDAKPVKLGKYYYRVHVEFSNEGDAGTKSHFERSRKQKTGYTALVTLSGYSDEYYTDGSYVYFIKPGTKALCRLDIAAKKIKRLASLPKGVKNYTSSHFHGLFGSKLYVMTFSIRHKLDQLMWYDVKTGKKKVVLKNQTVWNSAASAERYVFLAEGTSFVEKDGGFRGPDGKPHRFYVYDKKTGSSWDVAKDGYVGMTYAAGGGGYNELGKYGVYGVYDQKKKTLSVYKYIFSKKRAVRLGVYKKVEKAGLMWFGSNVSVSYTDTAGAGVQKLAKLS